MVNPNVPNPEAELSHMAMYEDEMQMHLAQNAPDLATPYGVAEMVDINADQALGGLACVYGLNSQVDDIPTSFGAAVMPENFTYDRVDSLS